MIFYNIFQAEVTRPQIIQGQRTKNVPKEKSTRFAPTATAEPLEDPPGTRSDAHGFWGVP